VEGHIYAAFSVFSSGGQARVRKESTDNSVESVQLRTRPAYILAIGGYEQAVQSNT
jgi:hypothetical protein